jgi:K+-transporting ATPase c subunit
MSLEFEKDILKLYNNDKKQKALVLFARYFANSRTACLCKMDKIDSTGLVVSYTETSDEGITLKAVQIAFNRVLTTREEINKQLKELEIESESVAQMLNKVDKAYVPPGRRKEGEIDFVMPSALQLAFVAVIWAFVYQFVTSKIGWILTVRTAIGDDVVRSNFI